jgi:DNA-binding beta-propeller fold protein YncE
MKRLCLVFGAAIGLCASVGVAQQASSGPYKVLRTVKVGGEGGFDYISCDPESRRLYVPRSGDKGHVSVYNLDTLDPVGEIPNVRAGGAVVDPKSGHGFSTTRPAITMWDAKALTVIKTIPVEGRPDGIMCDSYNERIWIFSHVAPFGTVIDAKDGTVVGTIDLGGAPEQAVTDEHGTIYVNLTDKASIAVVNAKDLSVKTHYDLSSKGKNIGGLAYDVKNQILFSYMHQPSSMVVILSATDGKIITTLPTGDGVDTVAFNPKTMEAISTDGGSGTITVVKEKSPTSFSVEQTLATMKGARTMTLDSKTGRIVTQTAEYGPPPSPPSDGGRRGRAPMMPGSFTLLMIGR